MLLRSSWNVAKQLKDAKVKQQMAQAIASYLARNGAVTRCPPARARGSTEPSEQLELLERPRFRWPHAIPIHSAASILMTTSA
jgi:hypothetical protein